MVKLEVLNQVVGKWYETIPGGRITLFVAGVAAALLLITLWIVVQTAYEHLKKMRRQRHERLKRLKRQYRFQPAPFEMVITTWRA